MRNTNALLDGSGETGEARSDADDLAWFVLASTIDTLQDLLREERARCCRRSCCHTHDEDQGDEHQQDGLSGDRLITVPTLLELRRRALISVRDDYRWYLLIGDPCFRASARNAVWILTGVIAADFTRGRTPAS